MAATITVGTNSYVTEEELATYAEDRGITISGTPSVLLIKAMDYLESRVYKGYKTDSTQSLQFPRVLCNTTYSNVYPNVYPLNYYNYATCEYSSTEVPDDIKKAQMVAAILIDGGNDLQPTITKAVKREKVDVLEVEYKDNSNESNSYTQLNNLLRPFLNNIGLKVTRA